MLRRFYTVMVVPHEGGTLTRLNLSLRFVVTMATVALLCFVSSAFLGHVFLRGWNKVDRSEQYRVEAERVALHNTQVHSSLYRTVVSLDALTARLEELSVINEWTAEGEASDDPAVASGGFFDSDGDASSHALEADWRGMAISAQDKAQFWAGLLERQICDRTSYLRALPTVWPVHGRLASGYQWRKDPFTRRRTFHRGIDIAAPRGTPVLAAGDGIVLKAGRDSGYGNSVVYAEVFQFCELLDDASV